MHDRVIVQPADAASGSVGMPPARALGEGPPLAEVPETDRMCGRGEHQRARVESYAGAFPDSPWGQV